MSIDVRMRSGLSAELAGIDPDVASMLASVESGARRQRTRRNIALAAAVVAIAGVVWATGPLASLLGQQQVQPAFGEEDAEALVDLIDVQGDPWWVDLDESNGIAVAVSPDWSAYAVSSAGDDESGGAGDQGVLTVIDATERTVLATVPVPTSSETVAIDEATSRAFVPAGSGVVTVVDIDAGEVVASIEVGDTPQEIALDSELEVAIVGNVSDDTVSVIDIHGLRVDHVVPVGDAPEGVAIDGARGVAYVANQRDGTVSVLETATWTVTDTVDVGFPAPTHVSLDERTGRLYVTAEGVVCVIDPLTREVGHWYPTREPFSVAVDSTRGVVYVGDRDGLTAAVDPETGALLGRAEIGMDLHSLAVDQGNGQVWGTSPGRSAVIVMGRDASTGSSFWGRLAGWASGR